MKNEKPERPCCRIDCNQEAEFEVYGESGRPDDVVEACEEHLGSLLGTSVGQVHINKSWTVVEL